MNILIDTHILIWVINDDEKLSKKAREIILDNKNSIFYSPISIWEIELKRIMHPDNFSYTGEEVMTYANNDGYIEYPLLSSQILLINKIERIDNKEHKDPFDKLLLAQAMAKDMCFMTHDEMFKGYDYKNIIIV